MLPHHSIVRRIKSKTKASLQTMDSKLEEKVISPQHISSFQLHLQNDEKVRNVTNKSSESSHC